MLPPVPQSAGDSQSVGKCKQFDCFRLAEIAGRTDSHAGRVIGDWLRCYYQPVVIRNQACDEGSLIGLTRRPAFGLFAAGGALVGLGLAGGYLLRDARNPWAAAG